MKLASKAHRSSELGVRSTRVRRAFSFLCCVFFSTSFALFYVGQTVYTRRRPHAPPFICRNTVYKLGYAVQYIPQRNERRNPLFVTVIEHHVSTRNKEIYKLLFFRLIVRNAYTSVYYRGHEAREEILSCETSILSEGAGDERCFSISRKSIFLFSCQDRLFLIDVRCFLSEVSK